ncbi:glycerophosphodiester phosphodiesterase family protein [Cyclobacterium sediminis]
MRKSLIFLFVLMNLLCYQLSAVSQTLKNDNDLELIAHRGGVVNSQSPENSLKALEEAINKGYYMVEVDVRLTKDGTLITHHDKNFTRYYGEDKSVTAMTWEEIQGLTGDLGQKVLKLETVLAHCEGKIHVMIDNKIKGFEKEAFDEIINLLDRYGLRGEALMIGTEASTEYFTGKIKLSCSIDQLKENVNRNDFNPDNYYLFSGTIPAEDFIWAKEHSVMVVGAVNTWAYAQKNKKETPEETIDKLKQVGVTYFQIDSIYEPFF